MSNFYDNVNISGNTSIYGTLNIGTVGDGSPVINLGLDSNGYVVTGTTGGGGGGTFTGNTSATCITDLYVSNIHSCSPLYINPLDEGNVYFGSTNGITVDVLNSRLSIGTDSPEYRFVTTGSTGYFYYDGDQTRSLYRQSELAILGPSNGITNISAKQIPTPGKIIEIGMFVVGDNVPASALWKNFGKSGDTSLYSSSGSQDLNIINGSGSGTTDNINFFAGVSGILTTFTPNLHIHGSGTTKGYVGINNDSPTEQLDVNGNTIITGTLKNGLNLISSGDYSHAEGSGTTSSGNYSHAEGIGTISTGLGSHAEGLNVYSLGNYSHAEGYLTVASGFTTHAEGIGSSALGLGDHAEGYFTTANTITQPNPYPSHSEGYITKAVGSGSHSEGGNTLASGGGAHAEGAGTISSGNYTHSEGYLTTAEGSYTHAEGSQTIAKLSASHAEGWGTIAYESYQHVSGRWNTTGNTNQYFIIGNGTSNAARSNALRVSSNGNLNIAGALTQGSADYAEYFESIDGLRYPYGTVVELEGKKIKICTDPNNAIGVISSRPAILGNAEDGTADEWVGKYEKDIWGNYIYEQYEYQVPKQIDLTGVTYETIIDTRRKISENYDESLVYVPRSERTEWNVVGLMGQIRVLKNQQIPSRWIKMEDLNDDIAIYLVR